MGRINRKSHNSNPCKDHKGNEFPSTAKMAEYWEVPANLLRSRMKYMSLERALEMPIRFHRRDRI